MQSLINAKTILHRFFSQWRSRALIATDEKQPPCFLLLGMPIWDISYPPLYLAYVSSIIRNAGWGCQVEDLNIQVYHAATDQDKPQWNHSGFYLHPESFLGYFFKKYQSILIRRLKTVLHARHYDLIGFSVNLQTRYFSLRMAQLLSASLKVKAPIIFGGSDCFPSEYGLRFLQQKDDGPDLILQGDAEIALPRFLKEYQQTRQYKTTIPGFAFEEREKIMNNGPPELPDLRKHPILADYAGFDFTQYQKPGSFASFLSRGCVNRCAFCNERDHFIRFRTRHVEDVLQEIKNGLQYALPSNPCPTISFHDSIFNGNVNIVEQLCEAMIASGITIQWSAQVSFSQKIEFAVLQKMYQAGCRHCFWGLETASQPIINRMEKNFEIEYARELLAKSDTLGIHNHLPIIVGFPGETTADILETLLFIFEHKEKGYIHFTYVSTIEIKTNSKLYVEHEYYGILDRERAFDWQTTDYRNTFEVRCFRKFLLLNAIANTTLSFEDAVDKDVIMDRTDFNAFPVASEIVSMLYVFGKNRRAATIHEEITDWPGEEIMDLAPADVAYWHPQVIPQTVSLQHWFEREKNSPERKKYIVRRLFQLIKEIGCDRVSSLAVNAHLQDAQDERQRQYTEFMRPCDLR